MESRLNKIVVIGLGLIGGSIVKALKKAKFKGEVIGIDADFSAVAYGLQHNLITTGGTEVSNLIKGADLVVLSTHLRFFDEILENVMAIEPDALITDVGSVKSNLIIDRFVEERNMKFIGGHPLAGSEKIGIENGSSDLFVDKPYYIIPYGNEENDVKKVMDLVTLIKGKPFVMGEVEHDTLMSFTSHIPHLLAALQVNLLAKCPYNNILDHVGTGFKDATRIAASSPDLWADIMLSNKSEILLQIEHIQNEMMHLSNVLQAEDRPEIFEYFNQASSLRNQI